MDISPDEFNTFSSLQQANLLWKNAVLAGELWDKLYVHGLYQLFDFYVEIKCCKANFTLQQMCAFSSNCSHLDLYLKEIDISRVVYSF